MAETVKLNIESQWESLRGLVKDMNDLKQEMDKVTDPKELDKLNKKFQETQGEISKIESLSKELSLGATFEEVNGQVKPLTSRLGELEDRMYELANAGKANSAEFRALQEEAAGMRKSIIDVDRQVDLLADNKGLGVFGAGLNNLSDSLMRLDFETATKDAKGLAMASQNMKFGTAAKSLKQLGSTFASLGKALLTNPLFLIVGVVVAIVAGIVALMDELGILKAIFEAVGDAIDWVIQQLKDFLDWLGLTNYAEEDAAERSAQAAKKRADAQERASNRIVQGLNNEIALINAKGELSDEDFERMLAIEAKKRETLDLTAKARLDEAMAAVKAAIIKGDADEEELKELRDNLDEAKLAYENTRAQIQIGEVQASTARRERMEATTKKTKDELAKRQADNEKYQQNRLNAERQIQDLSLELMAEGTEKELEQINTKYERLIEDTKNNEELTQQERIKIIEQYEELRLQKVKEVNDKIEADKEAKDNKEEQRIKDQHDMLTRLRNSAMENELLDIDEQYKQELELAKENAELEKELLKQIEADKEAIREKYRKEQEDKEQALNDKKEAMHKAAAQGSIDAVNGLLDAIIANTEEGSKAQENALVAQAIMQGAVGAVGAVSQSIAQLGPIAGPIVGGVLAAGIVATTVANIKNIKSARKGGGSSSPSGSNVTAPSINAEPEQTPDINLFGQGTGGSQGGADMFDTQNNNNQQQTIKAVVQWSDIDSVSNQDASIQNEMQL